MKRLAAGAAALGLVFALAGPLSAQTNDGSGIEGSSHDFSGASWNSANGQICNVCHTPHNPAGGVAASVAPLWDHEVGSSTGYTVYTGYDMQATPGQPSGTSLVCLSCHDGSIAIDSYGGTTGSTTMGSVNADAYLTKDLTDDHPIGFAYVAAAGELNATTFEYAAAVGQVSDLLNSSNVECSSCHDPHDQGGTGALHMLRAPNTGSQICLTCHIK